ncbi:MAG: hypothetical protein ACLRFH_00845 [Opitutales bacterium]
MLLISTSVLGSSLGAKIDEELSQANESFSNLEISIDGEVISTVENSLNTVLEELERLKNTNNCEAEYQIMSLERDLDFLKDLKAFISDGSQKEELEQWANNSLKFVPIILKAFESKGIVIY